MIDEALSSGKYDLITVTHNETSTGVMNPVQDIAAVVKTILRWCTAWIRSAQPEEPLFRSMIWGLDICITSTQKALGLPPGMAICTFSQKAVERAQEVPCRGYYLDLLQLYQYIRERIINILPHLYQPYVRTGLSTATHP